MSIRAVYPGTFDPITRGHLELIRRARTLVGHLIVAVAENPGKSPLFSLSERVEMIRSATSDLDNVSVEGFTGLLVDFTIKRNATVILKGLRTVSDFEYELQMAQINRKMYPQVETLFIPTSLDVNFLSSSMIKEIVRAGGNVEEWVPEGIGKKVREKILLEV